MDRTLEAAANVVVADLADHGGGTYERGTLLPFTPSDGFAVAVGGIHLDAEVVGPENAEWALRAVGGEYETSFVGTWLDDGVVYFDAVMYFAADRGVQALAAGRFYEQKAIYDFATKESISV